MNVLVFFLEIEKMYQCIRQIVTCWQPKKIYRSVR